MKKAAFIVLAAALLMGGCTITPQSEKESHKPEARDYDDSKADNSHSEIYTYDNGAEPEMGGPLVYRDFMVDDYDYLKEQFNDRQDLYSYTYYACYDENGDWYRSVNFYARLEGDYSLEQLMSAYGVDELIPYDPAADRLLTLAKVADDKKYMHNVGHALSYFDVYYPIEGLSPAFGSHAGIRFYIDDGDNICMWVMFVNDDVMGLSQLDYKKVLSYDELSDAPPPSPEGRRLVPRVMLKGMSSYDRLWDSLEYPVLDFDSEYVTFQWYDHDGNATEGKGLLKSGTKLKYTYTDEGIELEIPQGGDSMTTYISFNKYLREYELHDPYWLDNYGCTLMLGFSVQQGE
ncbi:hypothetical protein [Ruminococcus sp.]|uniref:hypothetical protein n=1 Tax=Ruminococcus sp. TaxID=41978 RepID=UPI0025FAC976|nr:hypothetical protein [Ruminococcus sp.]MBQ8966480.1 hypothetical protein [Ruminococcus sp.]